MCCNAHPLILGTDYTDFTDKLVFTSTKNRVNPCNLRMKNLFRHTLFYFDTFYFYTGLYTCNVRSPFIAHQALYANDPISSSPGIMTIGAR